MHTKDLQSLYLHSPKLNQLNILREVSANSRITQAELAHLCSLSVAMVNNYMKELCNSGWIEYHRKSSKSVSYHLTSAGRTHLELLQAELIREMASMFESAKQQVRTQIESRAHAALQRVALFGTGNLAQLAFHALEMAGATIVAVCDENPSAIGRDFCGREVISLSQIRFICPEAIIVADSLQSDEICRNLLHLSGRGIEIIRLDGVEKPAASIEASGTVAIFDGLDTNPLPAHGTTA